LLFPLGHYENKIHFDSYALTSGDYGESILIQRTNYNQMSWLEAGVAMIYWFPDFGDSLAQKLFPEEWSKRLGWGEGTYYRQQYEEKLEQLSLELGGRDKVLGYLIREEVFTPKHIVTSVPLALRGALIAKYWGIIGFIAFVVLCVQTLRSKDSSILIIALPLFFIVAFHAGLSVSIPRYNLPLLALYALSMAWYLNFYGQKIAFKHRKK